MNSRFIYVVNKYYLLAIVLVVGQIVGGVISDVSVIITFFWSLIYFSIKKEIDLVLIFLLLLPSIVLRNSSSDQNFFIFFGESDYGKITWLTVALPRFNNVYALGPVVLSGKLGFAMAVPIRLIIYLKKTKYPISFILIFIVLAISIIGLIMSVKYGISSQSGITIGLRMALSMGVLFLPLSLGGKAIFKKSLTDILAMTSILFLLGFLTEHWFFIFAGLLPFALISTRNLFIKSTVLLCSFILLVSDFTFTLKGIVMSSIIFFFIIEWGLYWSFFKYRLVKYSILILPVLLTLLVVFSDQLISSESDNKFKQQLSAKLNNDRQVLWKASFALISNSSPLIVPGGRPIPVKNFQGRNSWDPGAHNIFLEIPRQLGVLSFIILFAGFIQILVNIWIKVEDKDDLVLFTGLLSVFLVYGFTGNSLVYDGVGFFYWLIIGQYARLNNV